MDRERIIQRILDDKLIAILRGIDKRYIIDLTHALVDGGVTIMEVTFDQSGDNANTLESIALAKKEMGRHIITGVGTVLNLSQLSLAAEAGAAFIVSPDANIPLIKKTREMGLVSIPGAMTPGECVAAHEAGADFVKLFPAGVLGPEYLKAIRGPLSHIRFMAVGGIDYKNLHGFADAGSVGFGVGGNLANKEWIQAGEFGKITELAKKYAEAVKK